METDTGYFRRRASEERTAALQARDTRARNAHIELAERYEDLIRGIAGHERFLGFSGHTAP
jgi:tRNA (Thr-GGU) A37 N-methylase